MGCSRFSHAVSSPRKAGSRDFGAVTSRYASRHCSSISAGGCSPQWRTATSAAPPRSSTLYPGAMGLANPLSCALNSFLRRLSSTPLTREAPAYIDVTDASDAPGRTRCRRAVHWPLCSIKLDMRAAAATSLLKQPGATTIVLGPPVDAMSFGATSFILEATSREPVKYIGEPSHAARSRRCSAMEQEQYVQRPRGTPRSRIKSNKRTT
mmetsp:Transcript_34698/g.104825  ORF Transcript_34698/g.104825 Transcript_34698/m.104825 type:complete len:209 (+) Transcript_34698:903-1529(+)